MMYLRLLSLALVVALTGCATPAEQKFPAVTHDGLKLQPHTALRAVYLKPGADLSQYNSVAILQPYVAFRKNWQRNYNEQANFEARVSDKDMQKIRERIATEFKKEFEEVLEKGGHKIVADGGTGVLILRPAIIDLDVTAPDVMTPGMTTTFVASAGSMTLYMDLYDGKTQAIIGRVIDPEAADDSGMMQVADSVTNMADFDRIMRRWATILNEHLAKMQQG